MVIINGRQFTARDPRKELVAQQTNAAKEDVVVVAGENYFPDFVTRMPQSWRRTDPACFSPVAARGVRIVGHCRRVFGRHRDQEIPRRSS